MDPDQEETHRHRHVHITFQQFVRSFRARPHLYDGSEVTNLGQASTGGREDGMKA
jgi:hypothetical protein